MFGVATVDEGMELRQSGITVPIVLLSGINSDEIEQVVENKLTPVVFSLDILKKLDKYGYKNNTKIKYHLKIDTGMNRLGFESDKLTEYISKIKNLNNIVMEGAFTHLASADCDESYTEGQLSSFKRTIMSLNQLGFKPAYKPCCKQRSATEI